MFRAALRFRVVATVLGLSYERLPGTHQAAGEAQRRVGKHPSELEEEAQTP